MEAKKAKRAKKAKFLSFLQFLPFCSFQAFILSALILQNVSRLQIGSGILWRFQFRKPEIPQANRLI